MPDARQPPPAAVAAPCVPDPAVPKRQLRGVWITTVSNIDWPSRTGLSPAAAQAEYLRWLDLAVRLRLNAVFVQIRPGGDAFWPSRYEPWSRYLTGVAGQDPGWDPLAYMVTEAHRRNLQFHAWFNPYRVVTPGLVHPEWVVAYPVNKPGTKWYYDPGIPAARQFVEDAIMDAVSRYDVDGVHFDDFFYPYPAAGQDFPDAATFARYGAGFANVGDWRRHNIDLLIQELHARVHATRPWLVFGVSPFGIWRNAGTDPAGSATSGNQSYTANFADTRRWVREGWLDYIVPQLYWHIGFRAADYATLVRWWSATVAGTGVRLYIGQAAYRVGVTGQPAAWFDPEELSRHLALNREYPQVAGDVYFSARSLRSDRLGAVSRLVASAYPRPALVPVMRAQPAAPLAYPVVMASGSATLSWQAAPGATAFAVYRFGAGEQPGPCGFADARHLVAAVRGQQWTDPDARAGQRYTYYVTATDRLGNESQPSSPVTLS